MSLKNCSNIYHLAYTYLGYRNINKDNNIDKLIEESIEEIEKISSFQYIYQEYDELLDFLRFPTYLEYLNGSKGYYICAMTLGIAVDKRVKYYEKTDMLKMCVFDATASAYLEYMSDEFEKNLGDDLGYRFCPGYQGTNVSDIKYIHFLLKADKRIGITLLPSNIMIPQKSMIGIVGIKNNKQKSCATCDVFDKCSFRKEGLTCYLKK